MIRDEISPDLLPLIDRFVDETITADELRQLEAALRGNPDAQLFLLRYAQLHANLDVEARMQPAMDSLQRLRLHLPEAPAGSTPRTRSPLPTTRHRMILAIGLSAAVVVLSATLLWRAVLRPGQLAEHQPPAPTTREAGATRVRFDTHETRTIPLSDIGTMVVQGPADLDLLSPLRARLHRGRIRVRINSAKGHGYVVETPRAEVTDRGTEFGVDVAHDSATGVVVFEGSVNLAVASGKDAAPTTVEHMVQGDGLVVRRSGRLDRLMAIMNDEHTFQLPGETSSRQRNPLIADVWDNVSLGESNKLYEIVPGGLTEDALAYVDRSESSWSGISASGMPDYLLGADYVKTFNGLKRRRDMKICILLSRPARLLVFLDRRVPTPGWLKRDFRDTGDTIGLDEGAYIYVRNYLEQRRHGLGPGNSIELHCAVWERVVREPSVVTLGPNAGTQNTSMYGIAALDLDAPVSVPTSADQTPRRLRQLVWLGPPAANPWCTWPSRLSLEEACTARALAWQ